jgi:hypothetical protein
MIFQQKFLIQMHQSQMIGMMRKMENGNHHLLITQNIKVHGSQK